MLVSLTLEGLMYQYQLTKTSLKNPPTYYHHQGEKKKNLKAKIANTSAIKKNRSTTLIPDQLIISLPLNTKTKNKGHIKKKSISKKNQPLSRITVKIQKNIQFNRPISFKLH